MAKFAEDFFREPGLRLRERRKFFAVLERDKSLFHFTVDRKAADLRFGKDQIAIDEDVKLAAFSRGDRDLFVKSGFQ